MSNTEEIMLQSNIKNDNFYKKTINIINNNKWSLLFSLFILIILILYVYYDYNYFIIPLSYFQNNKDTYNKLKEEQINGSDKIIEISENMNTWNLEDEVTQFMNLQNEYLQQNE